MASVQEALFTEDALTVEVKESALTSSIAPKEETIVGFIGVRVICGVSDAIIDHPSYTDNYATARLGRLDVHGTYVNGIGNDDISVSTETPGVNVAKSDIAGLNADADGKYPLGLAKTTLTVDKTNFSDGNVDYTFLGWKPANGEIIEGSNVASFEYTAVAPTELIAVYNSAVYYTVKFADRQGRIVHTIKVPADGYLTSENIAEASAKLPEIFGYNKKLDEGVQVWNGDTTGTITCDTTFAAVYELDTETKYTVNDQEICFDQKMISHSEEPVSWFVNGVFADYGTKFTFYVFGDMKVTMSTAAAPTEPTVSILGSAEKGNMFATFVRVYNPSNETILSLGTRFTSATVYNQMNGAEWDDESLKSVLTDFEAKKTEYVADAFLTNTAAKDYMTILSPVAEGKKRYAKAFIETANGFIFSEICGNRATQQ